MKLEHHWGERESVGGEEGRERESVGGERGGGEREEGGERECGGRERKGERERVWGERGEGRERESVGGEGGREIGECGGRERKGERECVGGEGGRERESVGGEGGREVGEAQQGGTSWGLRMREPRRCTLCDILSSTDLSFEVTSYFPLISRSLVHDRRSLLGDALLRGVNGILPILGNASPRDFSVGVEGV